MILHDGTKLKLSRGYHARITRLMKEAMGRKSVRFRDGRCPPAAHFGRLISGRRFAQHLIAALVAEIPGLVAFPKLWSAAGA